MARHALRLKNEQKMNSKIRHCGTVESISGNRARVSIMRTSACQTCEASAGCKIHSGKRMSIEIEDPRIASYSPGDRINVEMPVRAGRQAVLIGFGVPLLLFVASLLAMHYAGLDDEVAALAAIGVLAIYYILIYIMRKRVNRHFTITLAD